MLARSASRSSCIFAATTAKKSSCSAFKVTGFSGRFASSSIKPLAKTAGDTNVSSTKRAFDGSSDCLERLRAGPPHASSTSDFKASPLYLKVSFIARTFSAKLVFGSNTVYSGASDVCIDAVS